MEPDVIRASLHDGTIASELQDHARQSMSVKIYNLVNRRMLHSESDKGKMIDFFAQQHTLVNKTHNTM